MVNKYQRGEDLVKVSMNLPRALWKKLKLKALREDTTATKLLVKLAVESLAKKKREGD
jgi:hypothetical protein